MTEYAVKKTRKEVTRKLLREASTGGVPTYMSGSYPCVRNEMDKDLLLPPAFGGRGKRLTKAPRRKNHG